MEIGKKYKIEIDYIEIIELSENTVTVKYVNPRRDIITENENITKIGKSHYKIEEFTIDEFNEFIKDKNLK